MSFTLHAAQVRHHHTMDSDAKLPFVVDPKIQLSAIESAEPVVHEHVGFLRWGITLGSAKTR